ncbi:MAG: response regulator transcription factor [Elusimicrobiota bacterium]|nr:MAG: response regulator transcription factor [Elusimicrobiota bacterium]
MRKVLIVDDEFLSRCLFRRILKDADISVCDAATAAEAHKAIARDRPMAVVLDWLLGDGVDGPGFLRELRRRDATLPVVMITAQRCSEIDEAAAFRHGANLFFQKDEVFANGPAFVRHLKALMLARAQAPETEGTVIELDGLRLSPRLGKLHVEGREVVLNPKELGLLQALLRHAGIVHPAETLWSTVWGETHSGDWHHTLDNRVSTLRRKLGRKWGARLVSRKGQGYLLDLA